MTTDLHAAVRAIIKHAGGDPDDTDLRDTPRRYLAALAEMTAGRHADIGGILSAQFEAEGCDIVEARGIRFSGVCPHHMMPYSGTASIRYSPASKVVGLSKLARLVDALACRLVLQEQLAGDLADAIMLHLRPVGVEVEVAAQHGCVECRGVRQGDMRVTAKARRGDMEEVAGG